MALEVPGDVPSSSFVWAGLLRLDGNLFEGLKRIGTENLAREINRVASQINNGKMLTQQEWQQIRHVCLCWCFSYRTLTDNQNFNTFLKHVGLAEFEVPRDQLAQILNTIEANHGPLVTPPTSPALWTNQLPPTQRLPTSYHIPSFSPHHQQGHQITSSVHSAQDTPDDSTLPHTPKATDFNTNPRFQGIYNFTDHRQEYEGYQFQCPFRCLKDHKHCRKAPVREMNRHLRDRHKFRQGFKIAGVDWEQKVWRGAGADHEEYVGKIVEKDSADDGDDDDPEDRDDD